jgi:hypothetical protein
MPDMPRLRADALRMIKRWGGQGFLVRDGIKRVAWMARAQYSAKDRGLFLDGSERFYIDGSIPIPPDFELDRIQFKGQGAQTFEYRILLPPEGPRPNGLVIYYDCNVMRSKTL